MKILIIIPYFGTWPSWFRYFLQSCEWNPDIGFLLVSDNEPPRVLPPNIRFRRLDLDAFGRLVSEKLGFTVPIINPYKICDLRPAFGQIFGDALAGFDYWGYSDMDLVFGRIRYFLKEPLDRKYDVISVREEYMSGHFALFRNTETCKELFRESPDYAEVFSDFSHHYAFDERGRAFGRKLFRPGQGGILPLFYPRPEKTIHKILAKLGTGPPHRLRNMNEITFLMHSQGKIRVFMKTMVRSDNWYLKHRMDDWQVCWENGKLTESAEGSVLLHFHFLESKHRTGFHVEPWIANRKFTITREGIKVQPSKE